MEYKEYHKIYNTLHVEYFKTMILTGLIKSTIGTAFISLGVALFVYNYVQPGVYVDHTPFISVILVLLGILTYVVGDLYKIKKAEEERLALKNANLKLANTVADKTKKEMQVFVEKAVDKLYDKIEKEAREKLEEELMEKIDDICDDKK